MHERALPVPVFEWISCRTSGLLVTIPEPRGRKSLENVKIIHFTLKEMFYLTTHPKHFIYGYMASGFYFKYQFTSYVYREHMSMKKGSVLFNDALHTFSYIWHQIYGKGPFR